MPVKILVADDSATMRSIVEMTFAGEDAAVASVSSGQAAVEHARRDCPDVLLADASMDGMDGYATAQAFKGDPALAHVPVILLTSQFHPFDAGRASAAGVTGHLDKPFTTQVAIDQVAEIAAKAGRAAPAVAAPPVAVPAQPTAPPRAPSRPPSQQRVAAAPNAPLHKRTIAFGVQGVGPDGQMPPPPAPAAPATPSRRAPQPPSVPRSLTPAASQPRPATRTPAASRPAAPQPSVSTGAIAGLESKLSGLGLTRDQMQGVLALSKEVVEQVVWEVVPELAEHVIREELQRLTRD